MSPDSHQAMVLLTAKARSHPGASSGERAAQDILENFRQGREIDFGDAFVRLDVMGKRAVLQLLQEIATGRIALWDLR